MLEVNLSPKYLKVIESVVLQLINYYICPHLSNVRFDSYCFITLAHIPIDANQEFIVEMDWETYILKHVR